MIPETDNVVVADWEEFRQPSFTHRMNVNDMRVTGLIDGLEALKQSVYKALNTERYEYEIYGPDYGIELKDLFGQPKVLVYPILCYRIKECLEADDRIELVDGFFYVESGVFQIGG